ncbi:sensor histidine kinase [Spelaeicoccus albus]|uniref:histidine kinase n=1 Tax=Spelaeicoccus albus TaxID=1280376 RepID=A0A7Z0D1K6_9MICO|nr:histidine kinase [Spelaeicoccus albus]NYI66250.1 signal transduction histidine kinase [Spelaeicoccus albus]
MPQRPRARSVLVVLLFVALELVYVVPNAWTVSRDRLESVSPAALTAWGAAAASAILLASCIALAWRISRPITVFAVCAIGYLVLCLLLGNRMLAANPALMFSLFSLGRRVRPRTMLLLLGALIALDSAVQCTVLGDVPSIMARLNIGDLQAVLLIVLSSAANNALFALAGFGVALYDRRREASRELARAQLSEHDAKLREALAAERNRMARELHDMAAHHLTALIIEAKAARRLQLTDPETTTELLADITVQGQQTLDSMRSVVGVLRRSPGSRDDGSAHEPQPSLDDVPALIAAARTINPRIALTLPDSAGDIDPTVGLACYRIIQESISNAHRHAPGAPIRVGVAATDTSVTVTVTNAEPTSPPPDEEPGFGLAGMRERAAFLGGTLTAGRADEGGWRVTAELPLPARTRPTSRESHHD